MSAADTDFEAMGLGYYLPGQNAFTAAVPRSTCADIYTAPAKRGPKPSKLQQSIDALSTFEERRAAREAKVLRDNSSVHFVISATPRQDRDKTAKIIGRSNGSRTQ